MEEAGDGSGMVCLCGYMHGFCNGVWCWYVSVCRGHAGRRRGVTMATAVSVTMLLVCTTPTYLSAGPCCEVAK